MTNAELIQKIRAEIERRKNYISVTHFAEDLFSFLSTLEEKSEKPMNQEGLEKELDRFIASGKSVTVEDCGTYKVSYHDFKKVARHFAQWGAEHLANPGKTSSGSSEIPNNHEGLDEAAEKYEKKHTYQRYDGGGLTPEYDATLAEAVIFGAKWQKEQDLAEMAQSRSPLSVAYANRCFENGKQAMKEQMLKEAVEGEVDFEYFGYKVIRPDLKQLDTLLESMNHGDKVRIIVIPNTDEK